jgi:hypothetical protein
MRQERRAVREQEQRLELADIQGERFLWMVVKRR